MDCSSDCSLREAAVGNTVVSRIRDWVPVSAATFGVLPLVVGRTFGIPVADENLA